MTLYVTLLGILTPPAPFNIAGNDFGRHSLDCGLGQLSDSLIKSVIGPYNITRGDELVSMTRVCEDRCTGTKHVIDSHSLGDLRALESGWTSRTLWPTMLLL